MVPKAVPTPNRRSSSRHLQHRGPFECATAQPLEGEIRIAERKALHRGLEVQPRGEREELPPVGAREIGDRGHRTLAPQQPIRKRRHVAHVDAGTHHASAGAHAPEGRGYQSAHRREQDRGIEPLAGALVGAAGPLRAELASEALAGGISGTREGEHPDALRTRHLSEEMSRGAEAVEAEPARLAHRLTEAREAVSAIADEPRAKKRGELRGRPFGGERQAVALVGEHLLGVTAVPRVSGEARPLAQILPPRAAIDASAAGEGEPGHPHAIADAELAGLRAERRDRADDLVTRSDREWNCRQLAI